MAQNKWKFIGGKKRPRRNLEEAIAAVEKNPSGELAIYNSDTGEIFSIKGEMMVPLNGRQMIAISRALAVVVVSDMSNSPVPTGRVMQLISQAGEPIHGLVVGAARDIIAEMQKGGEDGDSGLQLSEEPV